VFIYQQVFNNIFEIWKKTRLKMSFLTMISPLSFTKTSTFIFFLSKMNYIFSMSQRPLRICPCAIICISLWVDQMTLGKKLQVTLTPSHTLSLTLTISLSLTLTISLSHSHNLFLILYFSIVRHLDNKLRGWPLFLVCSPQNECKNISYLFFSICSSDFLLAENRQHFIAAFLHGLTITK